MFHKKPLKTAVVVWFDGRVYKLKEIVKHDEPVKGIIRNKRGLYKITKEYGILLRSGTELTKLDKEVFDALQPLCESGIEFKNTL